MRLMLLLRPPLPHLLRMYPPKARKNSKHARRERNPICRAVASETHLAAPLTIGFHHRIRVVHGAVEKVEHVATNDGRDGHESPVHSESVRPKGVDDEGGEDAEEHAVGEAGEAGDDPEVVRVCDADGGDLGEGEDGGGDGGAPEA